MSDMKCPFCKGKLKQVFIHDIQCWACPKLECKGYFMTATKDMWQELIRTRKALEIAWDALIYDGTSASKAAIDKIKEITALEQKE